MIYVDLFITFFRIGLFGFGGGVAMLPLIYQGAYELGSMSESEFSDLVGISQMTPGPIAVNAATYVGYDLAGLPGALLATFAVALPSFILIVAVSYFITKFKESELIQGALYGIRPMTAGLIASAVIFMGTGSLGLKDVAGVLAGAPGVETLIALVPAAICIASMVLIGKFKMNPLLVIALSGVLGAAVLS